MSCMVVIKVDNLNFGWIISLNPSLHRQLTNLYSLYPFFIPNKIQHSEHSPIKASKTKTDFLNSLQNSFLKMHTGKAPSLMVYVNTFILFRLIKCKHSMTTSLICTPPFLQKRHIRKWWGLHPLSKSAISAITSTLTTLCS